MVLPLLITLPLEVVKFDLGGDWAMVTVVFWPLVNEVYWARYVRFLAWLMLLVRALTFSGRVLGRRRKRRREGESRETEGDGEGGGAGSHDRTVARAQSRGVHPRGAAGRRRPGPR